MQGEIRDKMYGMAEESYAVFQKKLIFTHYPIEGIRLPALRSLVSSASVQERAKVLNTRELVSFEEVLVYGFCAGKLRSKEEVKEKIDFLLPRFDNWAHVDCVTSSLAAVKKNKDYFLAAYEGLRNDSGEFTKRFLAVMLMDFYLDDDYFAKTAEIYRSISQGQYYTDMALAWGLSVMLVKFYEPTLQMLENGEFSAPVTIKAIQKAIESRRISDERKAYLRSLKASYKHALEVQATTKDTE